MNNLDPVFAFDYPENTTIALLCEQPLRQSPDGTIVPGIAEVTNPDELTYVITVRDGVTFWNGDPVTADDVAFSLGRNMDPAIPGFYGAQYSNVASIDVTDERTVTVTMTAPDMWFRGTLASSSAWIVQKSFVEAAGPDFGNPTGRTMCSGSYQLGDWSIGSPLQVVRNDNYWDPSVKPLVGAIEFVGAPDPIALSAALQAGDIDGYYAFASIPTLNELKQDSNVTVTEGAGYQFDALLLAPREGSPLADVRVRQALSKAIDRQGYIDTVLVGAAQPAKSYAAPGTWGYARDVFEAGYDALPDPTQDLDAARQLVADAGAEGGSFTIGLIGEVPGLVAEGALFQKAAEDIGLSVEIKTLPGRPVHLVVHRPGRPRRRRRLVHGRLRRRRRPGDGARGSRHCPAATSNYLGYDNPTVTDLLARARAAADDAERAAAHRRGAGDHRRGAAADPGGAPPQHADHLVRAHRRRGIVLDDVRTLGEPARRRLSHHADHGLVPLGRRPCRTPRRGAVDLELRDLQRRVAGARFAARRALERAHVATRAAGAAARLASTSTTRSSLRYVKWLGNAVRGDFGISVASRDEVSRLISGRIWITGQLVLYASILILLIGIGLGLLAGSAPRHRRLVGARHDGAPRSRAGVRRRHAADDRVRGRARLVPGARRRRRLRRPDPAPHAACRRARAVVGGARGAGDPGRGARGVRARARADRREPRHPASPARAAPRGPQRGRARSPRSAASRSPRCSRCRRSSSAPSRSTGSAATWSRRRAPRTSPWCRASRW